MVMDAAGPKFNVDEIEELLNPEDQKFYDMLTAADQELWPGCKKHSQLSLVARLMSLKSENNMLEKCFNEITELMKEIVPEDNLVTDNFYNTKKLLRGMGLPVEKIDCCKNNCMIYWGSDLDMISCKFCDHPRFKKTHRGVDESDYFGRLLEVVQLEYPGLPIKKTVLFKCEWFDPTSAGTKVYPEYKLVDVNHKRRFNHYEPFVLAIQAAQVYYCPYPSLRRDKLDWWAVCKIKARSNVEVPESSNSNQNSVKSERLIPSHQCSATITNIFKQRIHPEGYAWKKVPIDYKQSYFEEFKKHYKWDESIDGLVKKTFFKQAAERYRGLISDFKKDSPRRPDCVSKDTWRIWEEYWDRPDVKAKSEQQRKNRLSEVEGPGSGISRHTGGSRSYVEHFDDMEDMQARVFAATQEVGESSEAPDPDIDMSKLYVEVAGGIKKRRIYGIGAKASSFISSSASSHSSTTSQLDQDAMKKEIEAQVGAHVATMQVEMEARVQAEVNSHLQPLMEELRRHGVLPPTTPADSSTGTNLGDN